MSRKKLAEEPDDLLSKLRDLQTQIGVITRATDVWSKVVETLEARVKANEAEVREIRKMLLRPRGP